MEFLNLIWKNKYTILEKFEKNFLKIVINGDFPY